MADEPRLIGTGRTPSEQDAFDWYMLGYITLKEYLQRSSPPTKKPEGSGGSRVRE